MRILLIVDETPFFHPNYVRNLFTLLKNKEHKLFGAIGVILEKMVEKLFKINKL